MVCALSNLCVAVLTLLDWRDLTGKFYSKPEGVHETMSLGDEPKRTIPFVAVGLNSEFCIVSACTAS